MANPDLIKHAILKKKIDGIIYTLQLHQDGSSVYIDDMPVSKIIEDIKKDILSIETGSPVAFEVIEEMIQKAVNIEIAKLTDPEDSSSLVSQLIEIKTIIREITDGDDSILNKAKEYTDEKVHDVIEYVDEAIDDAKDLSAVHFKGMVDYYTDLPTDAQEGDIYIVKYTGSKLHDNLEIVNTIYLWTGVQWICPNMDVDLSNYVNEDELLIVVKNLTAKILERSRVYLSKEPPSSLNPMDVWLEDITDDD